MRNSLEGPAIHNQESRQRMTKCTRPQGSQKLDKPLNISRKHTDLKKIENA